MKRKKKPSQVSAPTIRPGWITKTSPKGKKYRVCTIPLDLLPLLIDTEKLEPKLYFYYLPEKREVLWVIKTGDTETREL